MQIEQIVLGTAIADPSTMEEVEKGIFIWFTPTDERKHRIIVWPDYGQPYS